MAYYKDFTVCAYFDSSEWLCRLMAIGWLEQGKPYSKGSTDSKVVDRIHLLREEFKEAFSSVKFRGLHSCSLCPAIYADSALLDYSHINLFIPHRGFVFVAPGRVDHYIEMHHYRPPESFIDSLLACPSPFSSEYRDAIAASNRGVDAPIFKDKPSVVRGFWR